MLLLSLRDMTKKKISSALSDLFKSTWFCTEAKIKSRGPIDNSKSFYRNALSDHLE